MRRYLRPLIRSAALVGAAVAVPLTAVPASAGGPTSVVIVSPQHQQTASLYATEQDYNRLLQTLASDPTPDPGAPTQANVGPSGRQINVTWLIHDTSIWRVDRVLLDAKGGPWIETHVSFDGKVDFSEPGSWHRSPEPEKLTALMARLGVTEKSAAPHNATAAPEPHMGAVGPAETMGGPQTNVWWWALPVFVIGLTSGALGRPAFMMVARLIRPRARRHDAGPRQQLLDVER